MPLQRAFQDNEYPKNINEKILTEILQTQIPIKIKINVVPIVPKIS